MKCPFCSHADSRVIDSRPTDEGGSIRRRRECQECQKRFTTYEIVESLPLVVVKKDGSREPFDRNKLIGGFIKACEKRPISLQQMERAATEIEQAVYNRLDREVTTQQIGEFAMEKLRNIDEVAYVRFASVYRQFADIKTFMDEVTKLLSEQ